MKAESLPTHVTFPPYWKAEFVLLTRAENLIIVSSCICFWQHFFKKWSLLFRIVVQLISRNLYEQTCVCHYTVHSFFLSTFSILCHSLLTKSCAFYCVYQLTYPFPVLRVSGSVDIMYKELSQTEISSHCEHLVTFRLKTVFFSHRFNDI